MPLLSNITTDSFQLALWRIEEDLPFFEDKFTNHPDIKNENKRLQWYATRHLVNQLAGQPVLIAKDDAGKPLLPGAHLSLSHTPEFAAAMLSHSHTVGIDLEMVNPKVERIAYKFLRDDEVAAIQPAEKIEKLILYWSAKEALYKLYGKGEIAFTTQLLIEPFTLSLQGELKAAITGIEKPIDNLTVHYRFFNDHVLTYVCLA
jgi:phosphopantetheinyl transferase